MNSSDFERLTADDTLSDDCSKLFDDSMPVVKGFAGGLLIKAMIELPMKVRNRINCKAKLVDRTF